MFFERLSFIIWFEFKISVKRINVQYLEFVIRYIYFQILVIITEENKKEIKVTKETWNCFNYWKLFT